MKYLNKMQNIVSCKREARNKISLRQSMGFLTGRQYHGSYDKLSIS